MATNGHAQSWTQLTQSPDNFGSNPAGFVTVGNIVFFTADDGIHGIELWKSDGTTAGTAMVKDIYPGVTGSTIFNMISFNGNLFFGATDNLHGTQLWKSDGTDAGTTIVRDVNTTPTMQYYSGSRSSPVIIGNYLYFVGISTSNTGTELWKTDGTSAGTVIVKDINPGGGSSTPTNLINVNGVLYFIASSTSTPQLWQSDGTATGTTLVPIAPSSIAPVLVFGKMSQVNNKLLLLTTVGTSTGLWVTDGTQAGSSLLKSIPSYSTSDYNLINYTNGTAFLKIPDSTYGAELWKTDGTAAGTALVKDINVGAGSSNPSVGTSVAIGNTLYFTANDSIHGIELWKTDGTTAGTILVKDIMPGIYASSVTSLCNLNGTLYFSADDGINGMELWQSDGTTAGTILVANINHDAYGSSPTSITAFNNIIVFSATDGTNGKELWQSDGSATRTTMVANIKAAVNEIPVPALYNSLFALPTGNGLFFEGYNEKYGSELFFSNGTINGTNVVKDVFPGSLSGVTSTAQSFAQINNTTFFAANDGAHGTELWKTDGTAAGTVMVKDIYPGANESYPYALTSVNGTLYFAAFDGNSYGIWKSDGTAAGTILLKSNVSPIGVTFFVYFNGSVFFPLSDGLWKTDGTATGTVLVKSMTPYITSTGVENWQPVILNNTMYFTANDGVSGYELWKTDGTTAGTIMAVDVYSGVGSSLPSNLTVINGSIFFAGSDSHGPELWKTDGTTAGTVLLKGNGCNAKYLVAGAGNILYFSATDATNGAELWKTDGTTAGTVLVKDIYPGTTGSNPSYLVRAGNYVFFYAQDASSASDYAMFRTDGTAAGTSNVAYFPGNNYPLPIYLSGNYLYTSTYHTVSGGSFQLWSANIGTLLPVQLLSFTAQASKNDAICNWQTTHEINTDHFTVERSTNGSSFTAIGSVNAKGNEASVNQSYTYTDYNARQLQYTTLYYRLQSVDKDGSYSYSNIAAVSFTDNNGFSISPNPASSKVTIKGTNLVTVQLIDNAGKVVLSEQANNSNNLGIDISRLAKGLYFVQMKDSKGNVQTEKLVVE